MTEKNAKNLMTRRKLISIVLNFSIFAFSSLAVFLACFFARRDGYYSWHTRLFYFTQQSNLWIGILSFIFAIFLFKKNASEKELLWIGRLVVVIISIIAYFMVASEKCGTIMDMVENAWGLFGAAFGPVVILSLFWKRFTYSGAIAGIVTGAVVDLAWLIWLTGPTGIYEILPGFVASFIVAVVVTLISKAPSAEVVAIYEKATDASIDD